MPTPRMGRFSTSNQPSRQGQPISPDARDQQAHEAKIDTDRAEIEYHPKHLALSPEEIAAEEREKRELAALLKETRPAKPGPERSAPETLSSHPITDISEVAPERIPEPVIEPSRLDALEQAEEELLSLAQQEAESLDAELRAFEEKSALEMARLKKAGEARRLEIRAKQEAARLKIAKERAAALPSEIAQKAKTVLRDAEANRTRRDAGLDAQRAEFAQSWTPLLQAAKTAVAEVRQLDKVFGPSLREMAGIAAFIDTNSAWPTELRMKLRDQCILPARALVRMLDNYTTSDQQECPRDVVKKAEAMLQYWTPGTPVAYLRQMLTYINSDTVRYIRERIKEINDRFEVIEAQGLEFVRSGEVVPEVVVMLNEEIRQDLKATMIHKHLRDPLPTHAAGMGNPLPSTLKEN